jgi:twitching motility protein PilT
VANDLNPVIDVLREARLIGASDVHIKTKNVAAVRLHGDILRPGLEYKDDPRFKADVFGVEISAAHIREFLTTSFGKEEYAKIAEAGGITDRALDGESDFGPTRVHAYRSSVGECLAIRLLAASIPEYSSLGVPDEVLQEMSRASGLVIFGGPTGSGKSTVQAAALQHIANTSRKNIYTLEDPVEYVLSEARSIVHQVEVGPNGQVTSFAAGIKDSLRADPNVVLVGEARDAVTLHAAIELAEQGRFVTTSVHVRDASSAPDRIIGSFPGDVQPQIRMQLANALSAIVIMRLLPRKDGTGRVAACEVLILNDAIRALIRENTPQEIRNTIIANKDHGCQTLEMDLVRLVDDDIVDLEVAKSFAIRPDEVSRGGQSSKRIVNGVAQQRSTSSTTMAFSTPRSGA